MTESRRRIVRALAGVDVRRRVCWALRSRNDWTRYAPTSAARWGRHRGDKSL